MIKTLLDTTSSLMNLCLLRGSPRNLPYSLGILSLLVLGELLLTVHSLSRLPLPGVGLQQIVLSTVLSMLIYVVIIYALLAQKKWQNRFMQVLMALLGTELIIEPILKLIDMILVQSVGELTYFEIGISLFFITWKILIVAYILRLALEIKKVTSVLMTFCILIAQSLPMNLIFSQYYQDTHLEGK